MKVFIFLALFALLAAPLCVFGRQHHKYQDMSDAHDLSDSSLKQIWSHFKAVHGKFYSSDEIEQYRYGIFVDNMHTAHALSKKNPLAKFGLNRFADVHPAEFKRTHTNFRPIVDDRAVERMSHISLVADKFDSMPTNFDWRQPDQGRPVGVTAVKDQGQCGSCWAFSATEEVESAFILAGNTAVALAPEQTVDCDTVDQGCNGGDTVSAYQYMEQAGVEAEASYPYQAGGSGAAGTCTYNASEVVAKISGFKYATPPCNDTCAHQDENTLKANLYNEAPVSICVDASTWQMYTSGILTSASGCQSAYTALDHCVQLTGFGIDQASQTPYWSVRNSWATSWGENGYIRLEYGQNTCGVADEATIVNIA